MKNILTILLCLTITISYSQQVQRGKISYRTKRNWVKIAQTLPWLSEQEKQRMEYSWGKSNKYKGKLYFLDYDNKKSIYQPGEEESEYGYSWSDERYILNRDYKKKTANDQIETLGKKFTIKDYPKYKWKIKNEIKEVAGYICMKAETKDTIKNQTIVAWFTTDIPVSSGPDGFYGLPGMILEIDKNDGALTIIAENVELLSDEERMPKIGKWKGKEISLDDYNDFIKDYLDKSLKAERNPYWSIQY